jgi:type IV pilus assembly protein PilW
MKRHAKGFGLIEMLVALVIGLVLLMGLSAILISMTKTSELRRKMAEAQNGQRMAMTLLSNSLRYAGAFPYAAGSSAATTFTAISPFGVGQTIIGSGENESADTVTVRFVASTSGDASQGCSPSLTAGHVYVNEYSVADGYLTCTQTDTTATTASPLTVKLIGGLVGMNVVYGVDSTGGGFTTQYVSAAEATSPTNLWDRVRTVKVTLIFDNPLKGEAGQAGKDTVSVTQTIPHPIGL